jgi:hypothetical protein
MWTTTSIYEHLPKRTAQVLRPLDPCLRGLHHYWRNMDLYHKYWGGVIPDADDECILKICENTYWLLNRLRRRIDSSQLRLEDIIKVLGVEVKE